MSEELPTVIGRRIVGWAIVDDGEHIALRLDDGRRLIFEAAERCGDNPVVWYHLEKP